MNVVLIDASNGSRVEVPVSLAESYVATHCATQLNPQICTGQSVDCQIRLCSSQAWLCVATTLTEMARTPSNFDLLYDPGGGPLPQFQVPPQDPESRIALFHAAQIAAAKSMEDAQEGMLGTECSDPQDREATESGWLAPGGGNGVPSVMELFAANLVEALSVGEAAADRGTEAILGVATRDQNAIDDLGQAARLAWFDSSLSRLLAVQGQVGGATFGSVSVPTDWQLTAGAYSDGALAEVGIGALPPCRAGCSTAVSALRSSGVPFAALAPPAAGIEVSSADIASVVTTAAANLNARVGWDATVYDGSSPDAFAASLRVDLADLLQAVEQMRYEAILYSRPVGVSLAEPIRLAPDMSGAQVFASTWDPTTLTPPVPPPAMHYLTRSRAAALWDGAAPYVTGQSLRLPILRPERAHLFAYARAVAADALNNPIVTAPVSGMENDAAQILGTVAHQASARRALDVEVCADLTNTAFHVRVFGLSSEPGPNEFRFVAGIDNLRCAVQGALAGQPCDDSASFLEAPTWVAVPGGDGRLSRRNALEWAGPIVPSSTDEQYVVRLRPGATGGVGAYEAIAGFPLAGPSSSGCTTIPYDFQSYSRAAEIFSFTPDGRESRASCAGISTRLPLEDETIDDSDPYEDSWQHHLRVAASTAEHADLLGQQLIESGLEIDRISEGHVDQIEALCGTYVNLDPFADNVIPAGCDESTETACADPEAYECLGTNCVLSNILGTAESSQRAALEDCLGVGSGGAIVPVVALGRSDLCAWRSIAEPDQICTGGNAPCPFVRQPGDDCDLPDVMVGGPDPMAYEPVVITNDASSPVPDVGQKIGLVGSVRSDEDPEGSILPGTRPTPTMLAAFNSLRTLADTSATTREALIGLLRENTFFQYDNIRSIAGRIGWTGEVGNYSHLTVDGSPLRDNLGTTIGTTGSPDGGVATDWPCGGSSIDEGQPLFTPAGGGTFLPLGDCSDVAQRARINWRLGRASVVLGALTDLGMSNYRMPAFGRDYTGASMVFNSYRDASLASRAYQASSSADYGGRALSGSIYGPVSTGFEIWRSANAVRFLAETENGTVGAAGTPDPSPWFGARVNTTRPFGFLNFGTDVRDDNRTRSDKIARQLWSGIASDGDVSTNVESGFFNQLLDSTADLPRDSSSREYQAERRRLFYRALVRSLDPWHRVYLENGRGEVDGRSEVEDLTYLFSDPAWSPGGHNLAHLFPSDDHEGSGPELGYGPYITRRDLLDAMELAVRISSFSPPPPDMVTDEVRPQINDIDDIGQVQFFAERVASAFDALARVQIVRDVPQDVVDRLTTENVGNTMSSGSASPDRVEGEYGRQMSRLRVAMRTVGESPTDIAQTIRAISTELQTFEREQAIFERTQVIQGLRLAVSILHSLIGCLGAIQNAQPGFSAGVAAGICGVNTAIAVLNGVIYTMEAENLRDEQANRFDAFALRLTGLFDRLDSDRTAFLNAVDEVQSLLGGLRQSRAQAQSALAGALFASSDAAGRQYATNTVMRRMYDVNLQRYEGAHRAAVRSGALARLAVEQRFGVDLSTQTCAQFVDTPSTWADDICNATGVNYSEIRDPGVAFDDSTIRQMFVGDYVRRLEQYTESYRFDYPFQSGEDLVVLSARDDLVRAPSSCIQEAYNWIGSSNDLSAPTEKRIFLARLPES